MPTIELKAEQRKESVCVRRLCAGNFEHWGHQNLLFSESMTSRRAGEMEFISPARARTHAA
jgi:hypothetical protein